MSVATEEVPITELEKIEADRVDGVGTPANGIPFLMLKSLPGPAVKGQRDCPKCDKSFDADHQGSTCTNCGTRLPDADTAKSLPGWHAEAVALVKKTMVRGKVDEGPDIDGGQQAIALLGKLIGYEAQELAAGNLGEVADIELLGAAAGLLRQWETGESAVSQGNVMPATALAQSAAKGRDYSAAERQEMAGDGRALPDGSYPINDEHDLNSAAILARSGHGDVAAASKHIGKRARELGVPNPLDSKGDTSKSAAGEVAPGGTAVDTEPQGNQGLSKEALEAAVTKAMAPLQERISALDAELAKVKALPQPGGPMMSAVRSSRTADGEDWAAKAAYFRAMADSVSSDPAAADGYRQLARQADEKARA